MSKSAMIRARVDPVLKDEVETLFEQLGLSATEAITLFYQQVRLNRGLPFDVRIPNAVTQRTFAETDAGENIVRCENAEEMITKLSRVMNRARQDAITTEIMEIVSGAEAPRAAASDSSDLLVDRVNVEDLFNKPQPLPHRTDHFSSEEQA